jgi:hypothetical protein
MLFRHIKQDDDLMLRPEWIPYSFGWDPELGPLADPDLLDLRPLDGIKPPQCPFAWLFN